MEQLADQSGLGQGSGFAFTSEWTGRLDALRRTVTGDEHRDLWRAAAPLQQRFRKLLRDVKVTLLAAPAQSAEGGVLNSITQLSLQLSRLLYGELQRLENPVSEPVAPLSVLEDLLDDNVDLFERIQRQFSLLDTATGFALELDAALNQVLRGAAHADETLSVQAFLKTARRLLDQLPTDQASGLPALLPQLAMARLARLTGSVVRAETYAVGIAAAWQTARIARTLWLRHDRVDWLIAAALLQDCGRIIINPRLELDAAYPGGRQHPQVSSALLGNLPDAPPLLLRLVSQHHEQLDGSGFPRGLSADRQDPLSRLLAVTARFEELRLKLTPASDILAAPGMADRDAVQALIQDVRAGRFDADLAARLLADRQAERTTGVLDPMPARLLSKPAEPPITDGRHDLPAPRFHGRPTLPEVSPAARRKVGARPRKQPPNLPEDL